MLASKLSSATILALVSELTELINSKTMFSCFDITRRLRHRRFIVNHNDIREIVHGLADAGLPPFRNSRYVRHSYIPLPDGQLTEVYALTGMPVRYMYNPDALDPAQQSVSPQQSRPTPTPAPHLAGNGRSMSGPLIVKHKTTQSSVVSNFCKRRSKRLDDKRFEATRDCRGRLTIPKSFIKQLGVRIVFVCHRQGGDGLVVQKTPPIGTQAITSLVVDTRGNVRLSPKVLSAGLLHTSNVLKLRISDNKHAVIVVPYVNN